MLSHEEKCFYFPLYGRAESGKAIQESQAGVGEGLSPDLEVHASPEYVFFENDLHAHSLTLKRSCTHTLAHVHIHPHTPPSPEPSFRSSSPGEKQDSSVHSLAVVQ